MLDSEQTFLLGRLDGYLDVLSIINGDFRESWYFAYIHDDPINSAIKNMAKIYSPQGDIFFEKPVSKENWLCYLQTKFEKELVSQPFSKKLAQQDKGKRIYQIAWYIMEMVRMLSNHFESKIIYECAFKMKCNVRETKGKIYLIPIKDQVLLINLQWLHKSH